MSAGFEKRDLGYVSLFSGAGGMDIGLEMAGWRTLYASDNDPAAVETLKSNVGRKLGRSVKAFDGTFIEQADIRSLEPGSILGKIGRTRGAVQLLAGGPPCQSWSSAGHQLGFNDPRGRLFDDFIRVADELDPRWILLENVRGLLTARGPDGQPGSALHCIRARLLDAGFQTTISLLNAADFGVAQRRVRLFLLGFRSGDAPPFPEPSHSKNEAEGLKSWVSLANVLSGLQKLIPGEIIKPSGKLADDLATIPPGKGVKSPGKQERTRPNGHWGYKQGAFVTDPSISARTVTASAQQDWIRDPKHGLRRLCPRECAAIQSFPPAWRFAGNLQAQYRLIGNAVPPLLASAVGACLLKSSSSDQIPQRKSFENLLPLPERLAYHVRYTAREEASNGKSRRDIPSRRISRISEGR